MPRIKPATTSSYMSSVEVRKWLKFLFLVNTTTKKLMEIIRELG